MQPAELERAVAAYIARHRLLEGCRRVLVGVSGGPDSVCLLHALRALAPALGLELVAGHVNHGLRGHDSAADQEYVRALAHKLGLECLTRLVRPHDSAEPGGVEQAARVLRYQAFSDMAEVAGAQAVAVGHTADDQAETVLLHLLRGSGLRGLRGMLPRAPLPHVHSPAGLVRPLLFARRADTHAYCAALGIEPRIDLSNRDDRFRRNSLRHRLMPALEAEAPHVVETLGRMASTLVEDYAYLSSQAETAYRGLARELEGRVELPVDSLTALHPAVARRVIERAWEHAMGRFGDLEAAHLDAILRLPRAPGGSLRLDLPHDMRAVRRYNVLALERGDAVTPEAPPELPLSVLDAPVALTLPGLTPLPDGWWVRAEAVDGELSCLTPLPRGEPLHALLNRAAVGDSLVARNRRTGDRFDPFGAPGRRKLQDVLVDAKIPREWRDRVVLMEGARGIAWVAGLQTAEHARIAAAGTARAWRLQFEREV